MHASMDVILLSDYSYHNISHLQQIPNNPFQRRLHNSFLCVCFFLTLSLFLCFKNTWLCTKSKELVVIRQNSTTRKQWLIEIAYKSETENDIKHLLILWD